MRVSVIIPTKDESENAGELLRRLAAVLSNDDEIIFVDDGTDDLPAVVRNESRRYPQHVAVQRRSNRVGGLGGAVSEGFRIARGAAIVVCDGDLQHPPESVPALIKALESTDVVVASRYCAGGSAGGLDGGWRRVVSRATGLFSRALYPVKLRGCSDPMSGFFAVRRTAFNEADLRPRGFKILLELLVRSPRLRLAEIPFVFAEREAGASHATYKEGVRFLRQLFTARVMNKAAAFMAVGLSGVIPNLLFLKLLTGLSVHYVPAAVLATQVAIVWNFGGAELLVWRDHRLGDWKRRFVKFALIGETDLARLPFVIMLVAYLHIGTVAATIITLAGAFLCRFTLADKLVYRRAAPLDAPDGPVSEPPSTARDIDVAPAIGPNA